MEITHCYFLERKKSKRSFVDNDIALSIYIKVIIPRLETKTICFKFKYGFSFPCTQLMYNLFCIHQTQSSHSSNYYLIYNSKHIPGKFNKILLHFFLSTLLCHVCWCAHGNINKTFSVNFKEDANVFFLFFQYIHFSISTTFSIKFQQ